MTETDKFLKNVASIVEEQHQLDFLQKNKFNIFEILNLQTNEVRTHSAFLSELLNPKGSHLMGNIFLEAFLSKLDLSDYIDAKTTNVFVEKHIGAISEDNLRGGRLDIILRDKKGRSIVIENKIYADQGENQIGRYLEYNKGNNFVLLLTLQQEKIAQPENENIGNDISNYRNITYDVEVTDWLTVCHALSVDYPFLRENIKQYLNLIGTLTGKIENKLMDKKLKELILNNVNEARLIAENFRYVVDEIKIKFHEEVFNQLEKAIENSYLNSDLSVEIGTPANKVNSQIWIKPKGSTLDLWFGIQTFSGLSNFGGEFFVGIISINKKVDKVVFTKFIKDSLINNWWYHRKDISRFAGETIDFSNDDFIVKIAENNEYRDRVVQYIIKETLDYIGDHYPNLQKIIEESKK
ncbi:PD-(D/E)XK nuclease family protein [Sphingobacterium thalpophilum]|uniref:PDDEXK-like family protein n=1 Tax=Sphingobacterium thalpophilum TaxID=259 RepID=UPI003DA68F2B